MEQNPEMAAQSWEDDIERYLEEQDEELAQGWGDDVAASNEYSETTLPTAIQTDRFPEPKLR